MTTDTASKQMAWWAACALVISSVIAGLAGCSDRGAPDAAKAQPARATPLVVATNLPIAALAQTIAGEGVQVVLPMPVDVDPPFWQPSAEEVATMQGADLILTNGAGYERWLPTVSLPQSRVVNTSASLSGQLIELPDEVTHSHGPGGAHSHRGTAFTTWVDFSMAAQQARAIADALATRLPVFAQDPAATAALRARAAQVGDQLRALALQTEEAGRALKGAPIIASHPVFDYLARRAALNLRSVHWEPGEAPTDAQWVEFDALRATHPAALMLWEDAPLPDTERALKSRGVACVVFAPLGNSDSRDAQAWLDAMHANVQRLAAATRLPAAPTSE